MVEIYLFMTRQQDKEVTHCAHRTGVQHALSGGELVPKDSFKIQNLLDCYLGILYDIRMSEQDQRREAGDFGLDHLTLYTIVIC